MEKSQVTKKDAIHCETSAEFERIMELFKLDPEYMEWHYYEQDTVIYPFTNQYGDINGLCKENGCNIISSLLLTDALASQKL